MKNIFLTLSAFLVLVSCDKTSIQQTTDNIKKADSLFTKANDGLKTLDSISKTINDSNGIAKKVILPEIKKQQKTIDSTIKSGGYRIDSISKQIEKITENVKIGTDVVKTLDSANESLKSGESAIKVLTRTADRILNQTKSKSPSSDQANNKQKDENNAISTSPNVIQNPLIKTAKLEIQVEDLERAKAILKQKIRENNADLITENYSQNEGISREFITVKVPMQNYDQLVSNFSTQLGDVKMKNSSSEGNEYNAAQMADIEITLLQNENFSKTAVTKDENSFSEKSSNAFMNGFDMLKKIALVLLPFWPLLLIAGFVWYFYQRNKRKKEEQAFQKQQILRQQTQSYPEENRTSTRDVSTKIPEENPETDYSKYLPKK